MTPETLENQNSFLLLLMTFLPILSAGAVALFQPAGRSHLSKWYALGASLVTFLISWGLLAAASDDPGAWSSFYRKPWIEAWGVSFALGLDGLSGALVFLTNLLVIVSIFASWTAVHDREREFYALLLTLQTGILGTFLALDLFVFYVFWELMLIPLCLLIGIFGSKNRIYATVKFFLYTFAGSVLMLIGIIKLTGACAALLPGGRTFFLPDLLAVAGSLPPATQTWIFLSFLLAFAIKVPLFPFHTWLPDAHTEAPTAGSILLAGVLLKTGVYGLMRFAIPLFPAVALDWSPVLVGLSVVAILYGALAAIAQEDMKRLVAYSSVSHMGFVMLGLFSGDGIGVTGASIQMINHGVSTGALFFCVGALYERRHTRELKEFGGLAHNLKIFTVMTVIVVLSSVGLPGLNGFVGEFLVMVGSFRSFPIATAIASLGVIFAAVYLLRMTQRTFYGPLVNEENKKLKDVNGREFAALFVLILFAFRLGLVPGPWLRLVEPASKGVALAMRPEGTGGAPIPAPLPPRTAPAHDSHDVHEVGKEVQEHASAP